jgi:P-type Cu2+ transporter
VVSRGTGPRALSAQKLNVIVFDKTGTLTVGQPEVVDVVAADHVTIDTVVATAAAAEQGSDHPLGQAILRRAQGFAIPALKGFENIEGMGVGAEIDGEPVFLGNRRADGQPEARPRCARCHYWAGKSSLP